MINQDDKNFSFEMAYKRLEEILENLNVGEVSLEKSLELYEEADSLITICNEKLNLAEQKIQTLIKNRNGTFSLTPEGQPQVEKFEPHKEGVLNQSIDSSYDTAH